ncbi:GH3 auxin-responsive promoter family protein [Geitlerinema splendidum]|nr:GH3 auxin-responsive promoter family protein [Geitlerinema splendidum]
MLLFFEFIPLDRGEVDNPSTVDLMSLSVGERYEIVVTTLAGLYRYRLGDIVQCVGYYNRTPIVEFLYRQGSLLNLYNEKVSEQTIFSALTQAIPCLGENAKLIDYTTQMQFSSQPWCYIIYAEVDSPGEISSHLSQCQNQIECSIREVNKSYQKLREANRIDLPKVKLVQRGSFDLLKSQFLKRGSSENQFKMPRLLKNPDMVNLLEDRVVCEV